MLSRKYSTIIILLIIGAVIWYLFVKNSKSYPIDTPKPDPVKKAETIVFGYNPEVVKQAEKIILPKLNGGFSGKKPVA